MTKKVPILKNENGKTIIQTVSKSSSTPTNSFIIISSTGTVIVADPTSMPTQEELDLNPDAVVITHSHSDHIDPKFIETIKCKKSIGTVERFDVKDIHIYSIPSSHRGNKINYNNPNNVIYVLEVDGLKIAHMGDIGQDHMTIKQIESLGKIDIALMQFSNPFSGMFNSDKGYTLIEEIKPQLIIPTHSNPRSTRKIAKILGKLEVVENFLSVNTESLKNKNRRVVWMKNTLNY
ncbi:MBL fold metallo-hydrolase [Methanobacterium spitsbergense]|uniref:MBL fold metallo-hydrolase n=1 Tax=Methanobacterium spitsbergense TaxID=2874285 RepID=A0A8T5UML2_9EURY|nr:MBL fold metallo-hydrolase [Methanobacterium spitsbergense]MBZ2165088.1 MBL fold metallo-hydrolase [Methanobacterium spitsbergense]